MLLNLPDESMSAPKEILDLVERFPWLIPEISLRPSRLCGVNLDAMKVNREHRRDRTTAEKEPIHGQDRPWLIPEISLCPSRLCGVNLDAMKVNREHRRDRTTAEKEPIHGEANREAYRDSARLVTAYPREA